MYTQHKIKALSSSSFKYFLFYNVMPNNKVHGPEVWNLAVQTNTDGLKILTQLWLIRYE